MCVYPCQGFFKESFYHMQKDESVSNKKPREALKKRSASRLMAVQALYQSAFYDEPLSKTQKDFIEEPLSSFLETESIVGDDSYFKKLLEPFVVYGLDLFDGRIREFLTKPWQFERLEVLLLSILRVGTSELCTVQEAPKVLIINEYVTLAHGFFSQKEPALVHAILDKVAEAAER